MNSFEKKPAIVLIMENGIEYKIIPDGINCGDNRCNIDIKCPTCHRTTMIGEAKIPTGKRLLNG